MTPAITAVSKPNSRPESAAVPIAAPRMPRPQMATDPLLDATLAERRVLYPSAIVFRRAAFREIGGAACHYFDLHAESVSSAMIAAICNALAEPARPAKRLERFSLENIAKEYAALYMRLRQDAFSAVEMRKS